MPWELLARALPGYHNGRGITLLKGIKYSACCLLLLGFALGLSACGGGSSGENKEPTISYVGNTNPMIISAANASPMQDLLLTSPSSPSVS